MQQADLRARQTQVVGLTTQVVKIYSLETDAAVYCSHFPFTDSISSLRWAIHDENTLLAAAASSVTYWHYKCTADWKPLHNFRSAVKCMQQSATEPRLLAVGCADASLQLFDMLLHKVGVVTVCLCRPVQRVCAAADQPHRCRAAAQLGATCHLVVLTNSYFPFFHTQVVCTVKLDEAAVPCDLQFDPLSKSYLLLLCANGAILLYGVGGDDCSLELVGGGQQLQEG